MNTGPPRAPFSGTMPQGQQQQHTGALEPHSPFQQGYQPPPNQNIPYHGFNPNVQQAYQPNSATYPSNFQNFVATSNEAFANQNQRYGPPASFEELRQNYARLESENMAMKQEIESVKTALHVMQVEKAATEEKLAKITTYVERMVDSVNRTRQSEGKPKMKPLVTEGDVFDADRLVTWAEKQQTFLLPLNEETNREVTVNFQQLAHNEALDGMMPTKAALPYLKAVLSVFGNATFLEGYSLSANPRNHLSFPAGVISNLAWAICVGCNMKYESLKKAEEHQYYVNVKNYIILTANDQFNNYRRNRAKRLKLAASNNWSHPAEDAGNQENHPPA